LEVTGVRYREPYNARHSFTSWSLMISKNLLKLAQEDGHSVQTMRTTYAAWIKGATAGDITLIKQAMERAPARETYPSSPRDRHYIVTRRQIADLGPPELAQEQTSQPKNSTTSQTSNGGIAVKKWRSGRDSNPRPPA
jgi:hypothetical protein